MITYVIPLVTSIADDIISGMSIQSSSVLASFFKKLISFVVRKSVTIAVVVVSAAAVVSYGLFSTQKPVDEVATVSIGELKQSVVVTGGVRASRDANLSFQALGSVEYVGAVVGQVVKQGNTLASLTDGDARANLMQAKAQLASAEALLEQLIQGGRKEEIAVKQQVVDNAKNSLDQTYVALPDTIRNVDSTTADVVKNKLGSLFVSSGDHFNLSFSSCDQNLQSSIESSRTKIESILTEYQKKSAQVSALSENEYIDTVFEQAYTATVATNNLVTLVSNLLLSSCGTQNLTLDAVRSTLSTVKVTMNTLFADISAKRSALNTSKNALSQASRDLELTKAGTDPYKIKAQAAAVTQAEAQVAQAESGLRKLSIIAPFTGTVSDVSISVGETVTSGKTVISIFATDSFEIEAKVPEVDIVKVKTGADVEVTLDAYGKAEIFPATVTRINPTATIEGSVPMYKVIITFTTKDARIKSGMTANVNIVTENKVQATTLPARFIEVKDDSHGSVTLRTSSGDVKRDVILGVRGQGGLIEIISGVASGDVVVAPVIGTRSAQKQTN
jgi:RND family efflux transporter MFP subunit